MKHGKKYIESVKAIDKTKLYEAGEAIEAVISTSKAKFDETVELHVRLGVDPKQADQQVRGVIVLPNGTGKDVKVLVLAKGERADIAKEAGADYVGAEEMVQKIQTENWFDYDVIITTPDMMGIFGRIGKILGPKGLMPNPKSGTVTMDIAKAVKDTNTTDFDALIFAVISATTSFLSSIFADTFLTSCLIFNIDNLILL